VVRSVSILARVVYCPASITKSARETPSVPDRKILKVSGAGDRPCVAGGSGEVAAVCISKAMRRVGE
jgi:hypothetical protein